MGNRMRCGWRTTTKCAYYFSAFSECFPPTLVLFQATRRETRLNAFSLGSASAPPHEKPASPSNASDTSISAGSVSNPKRHLARQDAGKAVGDPWNRRPAGSPPFNAHLPVSPSRSVACCGRARFVFLCSSDKTSVSPCGLSPACSERPPRRFQIPPFSANSASRGALHRPCRPARRKRRRSPAACSNGLLVHAFAGRFFAVRAANRRRRRRRERSSTAGRFRCHLATKSRRRRRRRRRRDFVRRRQFNLQTRLFRAPFGAK